MLVILAQGLPASSSGAFSLSSPFLALLLLPTLWRQLSGTTSGKLFSNLEVGFSLGYSRYLVLFSPSSRFARKDTMFSTRGLFGLGVTRLYTVPACAGIIKQVFYIMTLTK